MCVLIHFFYGRKSRNGFGLGSTGLVALLFLNGNMILFGSVGALITGRRISDGVVGRMGSELYFCQRFE